MTKRLETKIPQILGFTKISADGIFKLKKKIVEYLKLTDNQIPYLNYNGEITLSVKPFGIKANVLNGNRIELPVKALEKLLITKRTDICFIERPNAVAIKKIEINIKESKRPKIIDIESPYSVIRQVKTFANPDSLLDELIDKSKDINLNYNLVNFWKDKKSFSAWKARKILNVPEPFDEDLQKELIQDRLSNQDSYGSWEGLVTATAKNLMELAELGMSSNYPQIQQAIKWLMDRPESKHNPGMFFLTDELVQEQLDIVEIREEQTSGPRDRFRKRPKGELKLITNVDELYDNPCGQRIMWPNAFVLEALLTLGYETHDRVQTILETLTYSHWCDCAYQHGHSSWFRKEPYTMREVEKFERQTLYEFKHGGVKNLQFLISQPTLNHLLRLSQKRKGEIVEYTLWVPVITQGCELITTEALSKVKDEKLWRLAETHLWRFVVLLYNAYTNQHTMDEFVKYRLTPFIHLKVFAKYNTKGSRIGILLSLPWIRNNQNEDGSWGNGKQKESATISILSALKSIDFINQ
ncbi:MAG: hypothetical protein HZR80_12290 [Candidatus Heimdallarchaeota archaeon]